jgi:hypothetical protein
LPRRARVCQGDGEGGNDLEAVLEQVVEVRALTLLERQADAERIEDRVARAVGVVRRREFPPAKPVGVEGH